MVCNDLHLTDTNPVSRTDCYIDELFGLLDQIAKLAVAQRARAVLIAGDIFHHKAKVSIATLIRLVDWCSRLQEADIVVVTIPGNHDLLHNRYESLPNQPLGLLYAIGAMLNVSRGRGSNAAVFGEDVSVAVAGVPFPDAFDLASWRKLHVALPPVLTQSPVGLVGMRRVVLAHCFAAPVAGDFFGEPVLAYGDIYEACPADVYVFGHDHRDGGVAKLDRGDPDNPAYFINLGAISRGSISADDITRTICCGLVRIADTVTVTKVKLNATPAADIFDLALKAAREAEQTQIDQFVAHLSDTLATLGSSRSVEDHLQTLPLSDDVRARMMQYIAEAEVV